MLSLITTLLAVMHVTCASLDRDCRGTSPMESKATRARAPIKTRFRSGLRVEGPCHWLHQLKLPSSSFIFNIAVITVASIFINAAVGDVSMLRSGPFHHLGEGLPYDMEVTTRPKIETNLDLWFGSIWAGSC